MTYRVSRAWYSNPRLQRSRRHFPLIGILLAVCTLTPLVAAQEPCTQSWLPVTGVPGLSGNVVAQALWDPDGAGPKTPIILVATSAGGIAGTMPVGQIAGWDPATGEWSTIATGIDGTITSLVVLPNQDILVGGLFQSAGGVAGTRNIARWNGSHWNSLGTGTNGVVRAIALSPDGSVIVGGTFNAAGSTFLSNIARWNGTTWTRIGSSGINGGSVAVISMLPGGGFVVGGSFTRADQVTGTRNIAIWNGAAWSPLGSGFVNPVTAVSATPSGAILACIGTGLSANISRWNGSQWQTIIDNMRGTTSVLVALDDQQFIAANIEDNQGQWSYGLARWDGLQWIPYGDNFKGGVRALTRLPGGEMVVGGGLYELGDTPATHFARWRANQWEPIGNGIPGAVRAIAFLPDHRAVVACELDSFNGWFRLLLKDGERWTPLGHKVEANHDQVSSLAVLSDGDIVVGGEYFFETQSPGSLIRYHDSAWTSFPGDLRGVPGIVSMVALPGNQLMVTGRISFGDGPLSNRISLWNGTAWSDLASDINQSDTCLAAIPGGGVVAAGVHDFGNGVISPRVEIWRDGVRQDLGSPGPNPFDSVTALPNGNIVVGYATSTRGAPPTTYAASLWNGSTWSTLGSGFLRSVNPDAKFIVSARPDGSIIACGPFETADGLPAARIARWDGAHWNPVSSGIDAEIICAALHPDGDLLLGGKFTRVGSQISPYLARLNDVYPAQILAQPPHHSSCLNGEVQYSISAQTSAGSSFKWQTQGVAGDWIDLADGDLRTSNGTKVASVSGSATSTVSLQLTPNIAASLAYHSFRCVITNECGSVESDPGLLSICAADFDCDGAVDFFDYDAFVVCFELGDCGPGSADFNRDGSSDFFDYDAFVIAFEAGC